MSIAKFIPAVTETQVIEKEPPKVVLELTIAEAQVIQGALGCTNGTTTGTVYSRLGDVLKQAGADVHRFAGRVDAYSAGF